MKIPYLTIALFTGCCSVISPADILYSPGEQVSAWPPLEGGDLDQDGTNDFGIYDNVDWGIPGGQPDSVFYLTMLANGSTRFYEGPFAESITIDQSRGNGRPDMSPWITANYTQPATSNAYPSPWNGLSNQYAGFRMTIGTNYHYGWMQISATTNQNKGWVHCWAIEMTPDKPILTGHMELNQNFSKSIHSNEMNFIQYISPAQQVSIKISSQYPSMNWQPYTHTTTVDGIPAINLMPLTNGSAAFFTIE